MNFKLGRHIVWNTEMKKKTKKTKQNKRRGRNRIFKKFITNLLNYQEKP